MSITPFDHFVETLENVPNELQRNFHLMADLDLKNGQLIKRINECALEYWKTPTRDDRLSLLKESMDLFDKARAHSDDKIDLAMQTYDLVDKHIRRLEGISICNINPTDNNNQSYRTSNHDTNQFVDGSNRGNSGNSKLKTKLKHEDKKNHNRNNGLNGNNGISNNTTIYDGTSSTCDNNNDEPILPTLAIDMPLDPNEPRYCTCHQVSFGEMIACDNTDCPIEWFHFACVDLKTKPKGKWYCPECFNINKKVKSRHKKHHKT